MSIQHESVRIKLSDEAIQLVESTLDTWNKVKEFLEQNAPDIYEEYDARLNAVFGKIDMSDWTYECDTLVDDTPSSTPSASPSEES